MAPIPNRVENLKKKANRLLVVSLVWGQARLLFVTSKLPEQLLFR